MIPKCDRTERSDLPETMTLMRYGNAYPTLIVKGGMFTWIANTKMFSDRGQRMIPYMGEIDGGDAA